MCNQNGLICTDTTNTPEDRIRIKKQHHLQETPTDFWYLQNISYYTNAPGLKEKQTKKKDKREERKIDGKRERREKKKVRT